MPRRTPARRRHAAPIGPGSDAGAVLARDEVDAFYRVHAARLRAVIRSRVQGSNDLVDDACAQAWLILMRSPPRRQTAFEWLVTVAEHEAWRMKRSDAEHAPLTAQPYAHGLDVAPAPEPDLLAPMHARDRLRAVAAALPERKLRLVTLQALGFSYAEIAAMNGATYTWVNRHLSEGYRLLDPLREPLEA